MRRIVPFLMLASLVMASRPAFAQSDLGLRRLGVAVGFVNAENLDATYSLGVFADMGTIAPRLGLETHLQRWSKSEESSGASASVRDISLGARGKYFFDVAQPRIRPFAGAGLGFHFLHAEVSTPAIGGFPAFTAEESSTKLGLDLGGGLATSLNPRTDLLAEMWYGIVSDVGQLSLRVGLSHKLGL